MLLRPSRVPQQHLVLPVCLSHHLFARGVILLDLKPAYVLQTHATERIRDWLQMPRDIPKPPGNVPRTLCLTDVLEQTLFCIHSESGPLVEVGASARMSAKDSRSECWVTGGEGVGEVGLGTEARQSTAVLLLLVGIWVRCSCSDRGRRFSNTGHGWFLSSLRACHLPFVCRSRFFS